MMREYRLVGHLPVLCTKPGQGFIERCILLEKGQDPWRVAITDLGKDRFVSTVFLGLDHNPFGKEPLLFESAIFTKTDTDIFERCSTWEQAEAMHERAVAFAKTGHLKVVK